eukprot:3790277-Rhodomonas_salina.3
MPIAHTMIAFGHDESSHPQDSQHPHTPKTLNSISQHPKKSNTIGPLGLQGLGSRVYNLGFRVKGVWCTSTIGGGPIGVFGDSGRDDAGWCGGGRRRLRFGCRRRTKIADTYGL